ncbi:protein-L-isoaspartate(D-aspartate) O-methyltransferase [bacterium]|nr:protein-L-isoaspartate(D-aspartate) O-methyltransferase [bacterium]
MDWIKIIPRAILLSLLLLGSGCMPETGPEQFKHQDIMTQARLNMVKTQIAGRGVNSPTVLEAMRRVERHLFVPMAERSFAYCDSALPIQQGQTISQPYIVGLMTELLQVQPGDKILEVGTGSGYQAAVLAQMGAQVFTLEIVEPLADIARATLQGLGYAEQVMVKAGDGFMGWPEHGPFDGIIITCAIHKVPPPLIEQLKPTGRIVLPLGQTLEYQTLTVVTKSESGQLTFRNVIGVVFVPMTGPHGFE